MRVTEQTRYDEQFAAAEEYLTDKGKQALRDAAVELYGDPWQLTIGEFVAVSQNDLSRLGDLTRPTVLQKYWIEAFHAFAEELTKALDALKMPQDAQEMAAAECMRKVSMAEGMLVFARSYFGLHSFAEAEKVTMLDYVIAKRDKYNSAIYQRRLAELRAKKYRKK